MFQFFKDRIVDKSVYIYILILSSLVPISSMLNPQLRNDEVLTFLININILNYLYDFEFKNILVELFKDWHPPGRNLFSITSIFIFGESIFALRLPYYLLWIASCFLSFKITKIFSSNNLPGFLSTTLIAGSGLFHMQIMGFGHGVVTFFGLLIIYKLSNYFKKNNTFIPFKEFNIICGLSFICFLFFNTFILITINLYLIQFFLILKNNNKFLIKFFISSFLIGSLHIIYLLLFLGLPYLIVNEPQFIDLLIKFFGNFNFGNWDYKPFGQYHQYLIRGEAASLNYESFISNISYLNWHFFPFISIIIIPISIIYIYLKHKYIFILLLPYFFITSFFMQGNTANHFASIFIWLLPFFSLFVSKVFFDNKSKVVILIFSIILISFTLFYHVKPYNEKNYPFTLIEKFNGLLIWPPNLNRPLKNISEEIKKYNNNNVEIGTSIDDAMTHFYFRDSSITKLKYDDLKILAEQNLCENKLKKIKVLIYMNTFPRPCSKIIKKVLKFNNSNIVVFLLN